MNTQKPRSGFVCWALALAVLLAAAFAAPPGSLGASIPGLHTTLGAPAPDALPQLRGIIQGVSGMVQVPGENKLEIQQDEEKAIIEWESFDIGRDAWTHFDQQGNSDWVALNRIYDLAPSRIFGRLTADGKVYLINQNGILFGPESTVNVHSLIGSTLDMDNADFMDGLLKFKAVNYINPGDPVHLEAFVANEGLIETDELGEIFFLAPIVENSGTLISPLGQVGLAAGTEVEIYRDASADALRSGLYVHVKDGAGTASNLVSGWILSDAGLAGMYGRVVNQEGVIRSITAVKKRGEIELLASDRVTTGPGSVTSTPVSDSAEKVHESFSFNPGVIRIQGLDPDPLHYDGVKVVEHTGILEATSGLITITARDRVFLESGSRMDTSGAWVDSTADGNLIETQLNSVELRDDFGQKEGLLKGQKIQFDAYMGSSFGDVSGALKSKEVTALEQATRGGTITIKGPSEQGQGLSEIVIKEDALISFAGGGIRYAPGQLDTTTLKAGNRLYDISEAPQYIVYDGVFGIHQTLHERYGITEEYDGLYGGGAYDIKNYRGERVEGNDAGTLQLMAKRIVLQGSLDGSVLKGPFQTEEDEPEDEQGNQEAKGHREPKGGTLELGVNDPDATDILIDYGLHEVVIQSEGDPLPPGFKAEDSLPGAGEESVKTYLSSQTLSSANLGSLKFFINTKFSTEEDAALSLPPGGSISIIARAVEHKGEMNIPGGSITLFVRDNVTTTAGLSCSGDGRVYLAPGSRLVTAGERINNFQSLGSGGGGIAGGGHLDGGPVSITVEGVPGEGVIVSKDSLIDVSGGYLVDEKGDLTGGDAGSLEILLRSDAKGALILDGELRGHAMPGNKGGTLSLLARSILVDDSEPLEKPQLDMDSPIPREFVDTFVLGQNRLDPTGFTNIRLEANYDLEIKEGVTLYPSTAKLAHPQLLSGYDGAGFNMIHGATGMDNGLVSVDPEYMGPTSITLRAGQDEGLSTSGANDASMVSMGAGSRVEAGPGGTIRMEAPGIQVAGSVLAPAGNIGLKATGLNMDLVLQAGSVVSARGYNRQETTSVMQGFPVSFTPVAAGEVRLESGEGRLILEKGSLVDVSGSDPVSLFKRSSILGMLPEEYVIAGEPGSVTLSYYNGLVLDGEMNARAGLDGLKGGSLVLSKTNNLSGMLISSADFERFQSEGFDSLTFQSKKSLGFSDSMDVFVGRSLILDAPEISGANGLRVALSAPWIRLMNSPGKYDVTEDANAQIPAAVLSGTGFLQLSGDWIDIEGSLVLSRFGDVLLTSKNDIRLMDESYHNVSSNKFWRGELRVPGNLTLQAERIYPTTLSRFSFTAGGKALILPGSDSAKDPVFSAGGGLTVKAENIEHRGYLAAPLGSIRLEATGSGGRVYLSEESVTTVAGSVPVNYGKLEGEFWQVPDRASTGGEAKDVSQIPSKSISISGDEVIVKEGSLVDLSSGGAVYAYEFLSSPQGSENPLTREGRYVILPDQSVSLPGEAVYLAGGGGIEEGVYSLLPVEFAFLPGAMILTDLGEEGQGYVLGQQTSIEGYAVTQGYPMIRGTNVRDSVPRGYSIRPTEDVLEEGFFTVRTLAGGDGGSLSITGDTTVLGGSFLISSLPGYEKGMITLAGKRIEVGAGAGLLPSGFDFNTAVPAGLEDRLLIQPGIFEKLDLREIVLGDTDRTEVVELKDAASIEAERVTLRARDEIILRTGSEIHAVSETGRGVASLVVPDPDNDGSGKVTLEPGSLVHASDEVVLDLKTIDYRGEIEVDNSAISLQSREIFFVPEDYAIPSDPDGFYIKESNWSKFSIFETIGLKSDTSINFLGDFSLAAEEALRIDASRLAGQGTDPTTDPGADVLFKAPLVHWLYSGETPLSDAGLTETGTLTLDGSEIRIGRGEVLLDGFSRTEISSQGDAIFQGKGSLVTEGDLEITASRTTSSYDSDAEGNYQAADYSVDTPTGEIAIRSDTAASIGTPVPGGILRMTGRRIEISGLLETASSRLFLEAKGAGADGVFLTGTGRIIARGSANGPGSTVELRADSGTVELASGSLIDVSAGTQGDAGAIVLIAPEQGVILSGELTGHADGGRGGSFLLDTYSISDFNSLNSKWAAGGIDHEIALRSRTGSVEIGDAAGTAMSARAHAFKLVADGGDILMHSGAAIEASGEKEGGSVELMAGGGITIRGDILAQGTGEGAKGGEVFLSTAHKDGSGEITLEDVVIDVSGGPGGQNGLVHFRVNSGTNTASRKDGSIVGASEVLAETVTFYEKTGNIGSIFSFPGPGGFQHEMSIGGAQFRELSGVEIWSPGNLTLNTAWNLNSRPGGQPGVLTIRAAGNLTLAADITDKPADNPSPSPMRDTWAVNLAAGADVDSPDSMAVMRDAGDLTFSNGSVVYTESAPLTFASGGDTILGTGDLVSTGWNWWALKETMNVATFDGTVQGRVGGTLSLDGGGVVTGTGDIDIRVGGDLFIGRGAGLIPGAVLSMGRSTESTYYRYRRQGAGSVYIDVGNHLESQLPLQDYPWDFSYQKRADGGAYDWGPSLSGQGSYGTKASSDIRGLATLGGGDMEIRTGGAFRAPAGTFGHVKASRRLDDGVFVYETEITGSGDLRLFAGGDVVGRFLVVDGNAEIHALGGMVEYTRLPYSTVRTVFEGFDARYNVSAQGDVHMGALLNPTLVQGQQLFLYSEDASLTLSSQADIWLYGDSPYVNSSNETVLAPNIEMSAGGDLHIVTSFIMSPSPSGRLKMAAGGDIDGYIRGTTTLQRNSMTMSDISGAYSSSDPSLSSASQDLIHQGDPNPVQITAGGEIRGLRLFFPKKAELSAGGDIYDVYLGTQNLDTQDVTWVRAGGDIVLPERGGALADYFSGFEVAGPGSFLIQSGGDISLGDARVGIRTIGSTLNAKLGVQGSALIVAAGIENDLREEDMPAFFESLQEGIRDYTQLLVDGRNEEAEEVIRNMRAEVILPALGTEGIQEKGNVLMLNSQISTLSGEDPLFIIAGGRVDVGRTTFFKAQEDRANTGIYTAGGGPISIFSMGDVNVNESRIMAFMGGDITVWADDGVINAGRGSKSVVSANPPKKDKDGRIVFSPPAVGSGIRTLTFDPDGEGGPAMAPEAGDVYLYAKVIDAGEAGIAGKNLFLGSTTVLNAQNISFTGTGLGVPATTQTTVGLSALAGSGSLAGMGDMGEEQAAMASRRGEAAQDAERLAESFLPKWLDVKVIAFDELEEEEAKE